MKNEWLLFQLVDSAMPTGAFSHSFGLETAFQEGRLKGPEDLYKWAYHYVTGSLTPMEGIAVSLAYRIVRKHLENGVLPAETIPDIQRLDQRLTVSKMPSESRVGGVKLGKRYLKIINDLYPAAGLAQYSDWIAGGRCYGNPAIVHGWIAAYLEIDPDAAVFTHLYASINNLLQSALRMTAVGQTDVQKTLQRLYPLLIEETEKVTIGTYTENDLSNYNILQEIEGMRHESLYSRLFMS